MNIENITSNEMNLSNNGRFMQIEIYEKEIKRLQQELQRKDNIINGIKKEIKEQLEEYEKGKEKYKNYGSLEDYTLGLRSAYISMLNKINEL